MDKMDKSGNKSKPGCLHGGQNVVYYIPMKLRVTPQRGTPSKGSVEMDNQELKIYIDLDAGLGRVRGNKMIYGKMLGMFTGSEEFAKLEEALAAEDWPKVGEVAHGIKGMTGNLGFTKLFEVSTELMLKAREGKPQDSLIEDYRQALEKTRQAVEVVEAQLNS